VNGLCPAGYACNANNYCCAVGPGSVIGKCVNGKCPMGYTCGPGDLCYSTSSLPGPPGLPGVGGPFGNIINGNSILPVTPDPFAFFYSSTLPPMPFVRRMRPAATGGKRSALEREMKGGKKRGGVKKKKAAPPPKPAKRPADELEEQEEEELHSRLHHHMHDAGLPPVQYDDYEGEQMLTKDEMELVDQAGGGAKRASAEPFNLPYAA
jgi:hypothetical protein